MKILKVDDIRKADEETIAIQRITSLALMERAATRCAEWLSSRFARTTKLSIFCGPGNNGGDGVSLARIMASQGYNCAVILLNESSKQSEDLTASISKLPEGVNVFRNEWDEALQSCDIVIDCIFGTGLSRPTSGVFQTAIEAINASPKYVVSIDMPSGLPDYPGMPDKRDAVINADHTLTFQLPRLSFMFPSVYKYCGSFTILDIGLDKNFIDSCTSEFHYIISKDAASMLPVRSKFDHKGNHGHSLLIAGSFGKAGAAILSAGAALHSGTSLLTIASPECNYQSLQTSLPEAMYVRSGDTIIDGHPQLGNYDAIAAGPGIGTDLGASRTIKSLIQNSPVPVVLDADALNILSENKTWLAFIPAFSILTPHPKEFARLAGQEDDEFKRLEAAREFARKNMVIVILKGAHTAVCSPDGKVYFNSSGNPGMAKGGTGDALTGILLSLMSQGLPPLNAAILGVYIHGLAADIALEGSSEEALLPSDLIRNLGKAFTSLKSE